MPKKIYIKLFLSAFFWGGSAIAGKFLLSEIAPSQVTFMRFGGATLALLTLFILSRRDIRISSKEHLQLATLGIVGVTFCYYFYFTGLYYSTAFNAALIESTIPLVTLGLALLLKNERFNFIRSWGFVIAYLGVVIIITKLDLQVISNASYNRGDIMLLLSTLFFGIYNIMVRSFNLSIPTTTQMFYIFLYGTIGLAPWLYFDSSQISFENFYISLTGLFSALFLSLGSSVLAYVYFNEGIKILGASKASSFINLVPFITIILAVTILRETPSTIQILGAMIVLFGVYLSQR